MDLLCERCGEPWDMYYIQHEMEEEEQKRFHRGEGCPACYGKAARPRTKDAQEIQAALRSVLGDDLDGLASVMEDLGLV